MGKSCRQKLIRCGSRLELGFQWKGNT